MNLPESALLSSADLLAQLHQLTAGLYYLSESDAPLEIISCLPVAGPLLSPELLRALGEPADAPVTIHLPYFLRHHTDPAGVLNDPALAARYQALQAFLAQQLPSVQVYQVGTEPRLRAYALGQLPDGSLAGFKTVLVQT